MHSQAHEYSTTGTQEGMQVGGHEHMSANTGNTSGHSGGWVQEHRWAHLGTHGQEGSGTHVHTRACGWANTGTHLGTWMGQGHAGVQTWAHMLIVVQTQGHVCKHTFTHADVQIQVYMQSHLHTHTHTHSCSHVHSQHTHICTVLQTYVNTHANTWTLVQPHLHTYGPAHTNASPLYTYSRPTHMSCVSLQGRKMASCADNVTAGQGGPARVVTSYVCQAILVPPDITGARAAVSSQPVSLGDHLLGEWRAGRRGVHPGALGHPGGH